MGCDKKRAKPVLSCMARQSQPYACEFDMGWKNEYGGPLTIELNIEPLRPCVYCTNGVPAKSANLKLEHPVYKCVRIICRLRKFDAKVSTHSYGLTVSKLSNLAPNIGQWIRFLKHI